MLSPGVKTPSCRRKNQRPVVSTDVARKIYRENCRKSLAARSRNLSFRKKRRTGWRTSGPKNFYRQFANEASGFCNRKSGNSWANGRSKTFRWISSYGKICYECWTCFPAHFAFAHPDFFGIQNINLIPFDFLVAFAFASL